MSFFTNEFKEAISHLPAKEKDKLLIRLLKKDLKLTKRLTFELLNLGTVDERRLLVEKNIISNVAQMTKNFYSIGYLNLDVRDLSGYITEHVGTTKDKYGNVSLNLLLLKEANLCLKKLSASFIFKPANVLKDLIGELPNKLPTNILDSFNISLISVLFIF